MVWFFITIILANSFIQTLCESTYKATTSLFWFHFLVLKKMVKRRLMVPAEDVDLSSVKYEPETIQGQPTYSNSISFTGLLSFFIFVRKNSVFVVRALLTCSLKTTKKLWCLLQHRIWWGWCSSCLLGYWKQGCWVLWLCLTWKSKIKWLRFVSLIFFFFRFCYILDWIMCNKQVGLFLTIRELDWQMLRNTVIPEAPMFRPEFPPQGWYFFPCTH